MSLWLKTLAAKMAPNKTSSSPQEMSFFPPLVEKYEEVFIPLIPGVKGMIETNAMSLRALQEYDEKEKHVATRPACFYNAIGSESGLFNNLLLTGLFEGAVILAQTFELYQIKNSKPQQQVIEVMDSLGIASNCLFEMIHSIKLAISKDGFLAITPSLSRFIHECYKGVNDLTMLVLNQMSSMNDMINVDDWEFHHSFSNTLFSWPRVNSETGHQTEFIWNSDVDQLIDHFEIAYSNVIEYTFRLLLARRDRNFDTHEKFQNVFETGLCEIRNINTNLLAQVQAAKEIFGNNFDSRGVEEEIVKVDKFSREYQMYASTGKFRNKLREFDSAFAVMESHGQSLAFGTDNGRSGNLEEISKERERLDLMFHALTLDYQRYSCLIKTLDTKPKNLAEAHPSHEISPNVEQDINEGVNCWPQSNFDEHFFNLTYEPDERNDFEREDKEVDQLFFGRGKLGDDLSDTEPEKQGSEKLVDMVFSGVLDELKTKLTDRKDQMVSRELKAFKRTYPDEELLESDSEEFEMIEIPPRPESKSNFEVRFTAKDDEVQVNIDLSHEADGTRASIQGSSFKQDLLKALSTRAGISTDIYEDGKDIESENEAVATTSTTYF